MGHVDKDRGKAFQEEGYQLEEMSQKRIYKQSDENLTCCD